ncbi:MAG TPA: GNAT family N-acetyltransferase [Tepidisphaeraceae bacterium]|jgi:aminoglycoside 6'-N-acetyltransferase I
MAEVTITRLSIADIAKLHQVAPGVFDHAINPQLCREFLADPRHHLVVAIELATVVGMASAVHYVHPDKAPQLFINEVAVAPTHWNQGIGRQLLDAMLAIARHLGCTEAWVLTDRDNVPAMRLYKSAGGEEAPRDQVMFTFKL